jgi:oligopeptidase B
MPDKKPVRLEIHGDVRSDEYFWLRERDNPDVIAYLEEENAHTEEVMRPLAGLQKTLFDEMKARIKQEDQSAPYRHGDYFYYQRYEKGSEYPVYARKKGSLEAEEEVLLDVNELAGSTEYFALRGFKVSPDHRIAVYGVDTRGRRFYDLFFLDLESKALLGDQIEDVTSNFEWANDSRTLLYAVQHPETLRSYRVYSHELGSESDKLVYEEADETNYLDISKSLSGRFFYLVSSQTLSTEVRYLSADSPADDVSVFLPREANHEYFVTDGADRFFIVSNAGAENFRVLETPLDDWRSLTGQPAPCSARNSTKAPTRWMRTTTSSTRRRGSAMPTSP